jgi:hypothetical protein
MTQLRTPLKSTPLLLGSRSRSGGGRGRYARSAMRLVLSWAVMSWLRRTLVATGGRPS